MASAANAASSSSAQSSLNEAAQFLENYSESLQQDLDEIEDKLRKLYSFNSAVNGLFIESYGKKYFNKHILGTSKEDNTGNSQR